MIAVKRKMKKPICERCDIEMELITILVGDEEKKEESSYWQCDQCSNVIGYNEATNEADDEPAIREGFIPKLQNRYYIIYKTDDEIRMYNPIVRKLKILMVGSGKQEIKEVVNTKEQREFSAIIINKLKTEHIE